jgi:hypothetical protein
MSEMLSTLAGPVRRLAAVSIVLFGALALAGCTMESEEMLLTETDFVQPLPDEVTLFAYAIEDAFDPAAKPAFLQMEDGKPDPMTMTRQGAGYADDTGDVLFFADAGEHFIAALPTDSGVQYAFLKPSGSLLAVPVFNYAELQAAADERGKAALAGTDLDGDTLRIAKREALFYMGEQLAAGTVDAPTVLLLLAVPGHTDGTDTATAPPGRFDLVDGEWAASKSWLEEPPPAEAPAAAQPPAEEPPPPAAAAPAPAPAPPPVAESAPTAPDNFMDWTMEEDVDPFTDQKRRLAYIDAAETENAAENAVLYLVCAKGEAAVYVDFRSPVGTLNIGDLQLVGVDLRFDQDQAMRTGWLRVSQGEQVRSLSSAESGAAQLALGVSAILAPDLAEIDVGWTAHAFMAELMTSGRVLVRAPAVSGGAVTARFETGLSLVPIGHILAECPAPAAQ